MLKEEIVRQSEDILIEYEAARVPWANESKEAEDFALGNQWTKKQIEELKKRRQSAVVINVIHPAVDQAIALLTTNKPRFSSTGREDSDTKTGKVFGELMSYIWDNSTGNTELKTTIYDAYVKSQGYLLAYIDPYADFGKGDICLKSIDPYDVFVDPNSKDKFYRDAANIIISKILTKEEAERMYPEVDMAEAEEKDDSRQPSGTKDNPLSHSGVYKDNTHKRYELIDRYYKKKIVYVHVYDPSSELEKVLTDEEFKEFVQKPAAVRIQEGQPPVFITREDKVQQMMQLAEQTGGVFHYMQDPQTGEPQMMPGPAHEGALPGSQTEIQIVSMQQLIEAEIIAVRKIYQDRIFRVLSIGGIKIWEGVMGNLDEYPIVPLTFTHQRSPYPKSEVSKVRGLQESINKIRSLILAHAASSANLKVILPRGSMDKKTFESEFAKAGTAVLEVDMETGVPQIVAPPALPNELYKSEEDMRKDIQEILGIYALMQGDSGQAPATYKGTVAMDEFGQRRIKSKKDDVEGTLNQLAKVVVQMIQMVYTEPKVFRVLRPNNIEQQININMPIYDDVTGGITGKLNDVTVGKYDVVVVSGSMLPSNRWAVLEYYMELFKMGIIDQVEVLKKTEVADTEGVLERYSMMSQMQNQIAQMDEQIKKLQGDLQTRDREVVNALKRVELAKFGADLDKAQNRAEAGVEVFTKRMNDELQIERIRKREANRKPNSSKK